MSFLTAGIEGNLFSDNVRKAILINLFAAVSLILLLFYGIRSLGTDVYYLGYLYFFLSAVVMAIIYYFQKTKEILFVSHFMVFLLASLLLFFLVRNGGSNLHIKSYFIFPGVYWFFVFPSYCLFLLGRKRGTYIFFTITAILLFFFCISLPVTKNFDNEFVIRFLTLYIAIFLFVYVFEYIRELTFQSFTKSQIQNEKYLHELSQQKTSLEEKNLELARLNNEIFDQHNQLKLLNATKDKFFSIIAHDLRGPIGNYSEIIKLITRKENIFTHEQIKDILGKLEKSTKNTKELLDNLLEWALAQQKEIVYNPQNYQIAKLIETNLEILLINLESKNIQLEKNIDTNLTAYVDYNTINVVLRNILSNAIKYSHTNSRIIVTALANEQNVEISVQDFGIGMDKNYSESLFQLDKKSISRHGTNGETGTGLGLILVSDFLRINKGTIHVESEPTKGTKIIISVPSK